MESPWSWLDVQTRTLRLSRWLWCINPRQLFQQNSSIAPLRFERKAPTPGDWNAEVKVKQTQAKKMRQAKAFWLKWCPHVCVSCVRPRYASHVRISWGHPMYALVSGTGLKFCTSFWRVLGVQNLIFFKFVHYIFGFESNI